MAPSRGFGELQTPGGLLAKLHHDLKRFESAPGDQCAAFDFFVTADSLVDWLHPDMADRPGETSAAKDRRRALRNGNPLTRITAHIANGAKHFVATRHSAIAGIEKDRYVEKGYVEDGYFVDPVVIQLSAREAQELNLPEMIEGLELARMVLRFHVEAGHGA